MRLIVIEDNAAVLANFKELLGYEFPEVTLERAIFIDGVSGIKEGLKDLLPNEKYVIILDNEIHGGTSVESLNALKDITEVWNNLEKIYGFSNQDIEQEKLVHDNFPELQEPLYTQSNKLRLIELVPEIAKSFPDLAQEPNKEVTRVA